MESVKPTIGYFFAEIDVADPEEYKKYLAGVPATIAQYGGRYVVRGGNGVALDGPGPKRIVVVAFDSVAAAQRWFNSPEYSALKPIRERSATSRAFIVEGVPPS